ncbi:hypothetical protein [Paraburkholderia humisilvae]|uniref:DUF5983 domain-containing protein n=1 Tax=Paraburkholderia humisilvae TaxID=627669 RepID=A0A6J5DMU1_9BURK|nr:hypothetical protein [Paraburkholderia humisilvae]CAB3754531.1 hypothetical protein LMG29542_02376 [Paraburkholderia humisilvae]
MSSLVLISRELLRSLITMSKDQVQGRIGASDELDVPARNKAVAAAEILYSKSEIAFSDLNVCPRIATNHITRETLDLLEGQGDNNPWCYCGSYEFGFFLSVPSDGSVETFASQGCPVPADLQALWAWATARGFQWIQLDADGSDVEGLTAYDW